MSRAGGALGGRGARRAPRAGRVEPAAGVSRRVQGRSVPRGGPPRPRARARDPRARASGYGRGSGLGYGTASGPSDPSRLAPGSLPAGRSAACGPRVRRAERGAHAAAVQEQWPPTAGGAVPMTTTAMTTATSVPVPGGPCFACSRVQGRPGLSARWTTVRVSPLRCSVRPGSVAVACGSPVRTPLPGPGRIEPGVSAGRGLPGPRGPARRFGVVERRPVADVVPDRLLASRSRGATVRGSAPGGAEPRREACAGSRPAATDARPPVARAENGEAAYPERSGRPVVSREKACSSRSVWARPISARSPPASRSRAVRTATVR